MSNPRLDPANSINVLDGSRGVIDFGDRAKTYIIDLDTIEFSHLDVLGSKHNQTVRDIMKIGGTELGERRFQNSDLGLLNDDELHPELIALIEAATRTRGAPGSGEVSLAGVGTDFIEVAIDGRWSTDILRFEGADIHEALPTLLDLKNADSQVALYDYDQANRFFHGSSADVDSAGAKAILDGSSMGEDEARELIEYALSAEGQLDDGISIDIIDGGFVVSIDASRDTVDTMIIKGIELSELELSTVLGNPGLDLKNNKSQTAFFDFSGEGNESYFSGDDGGLNPVLRAIIGGSKLDESEAIALVTQALTGDENDGIEYLGGDANTAIVRIDTQGDSFDTIIFEFSSEFFG